MSGRLLPALHAIAQVCCVNASSRSLSWIVCNLSSHHFTYAAMAQCCGLSILQYGLQICNCYSPNSRVPTVSYFFKPLLRTAYYLDFQPAILSATCSTYLCICCDGSYYISVTSNLVFPHHCRVFPTMREFFFTAHALWGFPRGLRPNFVTVSRCDSLIQINPFYYC